MIDRPGINPLFTIGHSSHTQDRFLALLVLHGIDAIADVRSQPYSRRFPHFSRPVLESALRRAGVQYVFLGRELGARRDERECYSGGAVSFERVAAAPLFVAGLARLREGTRNFRIALLCVEKDPLDCHRAVLVARHAAGFARVGHILANGDLESHAQMERRMMERYEQGEPDMFRSPEERLAAAYARSGMEIAVGWREQ